MIPLTLWQQKPEGPEDSGTGGWEQAPGWRGDILEYIRLD